MLKYLNPDIPHDELARVKKHNRLAEISKQSGELQEKDSQHNPAQSSKIQILDVFIDSNSDKQQGENVQRITHDEQEQANYKTPFVRFEVDKHASCEFPTERFADDIFFVSI